MLNAVKRELRYMLEATIKYAAVDQLCKGKLLKKSWITSIKKYLVLLLPIDELNGLTESMVKRYERTLFEIISVYTSI